ncbi:DUF4349 domain-containing protein [Chitinophaga agri]|uniref:DUF4349 domain-containing protein n=1 Tax=Chitinophaga agri TaxID=2703787 RepID=A0A6B9ZDW7_9BACT|nr:DUF4349 domain-containing protein [Chitinophaga agri]QHS59504.1 DUF4349 domain-containing protein [Chitinophaga agri]
MTGRCFILKNTPIPVSVLVCSFSLLSACGHKAGPAAADPAYRNSYKAMELKAPDNFTDGASAPDSYNEQEAIHHPADDVTAAEASNNTGAFTAPTLAQSAVIPRKIIKTGTIRYSVNDYNNARKELREVVARYHGDIIDDNEQRSEFTWETRMAIQVPVEKFDSCLEAISGNAQTLIVKTVSAEDKTAEYIDVAARMKAKKEVELRYLEILKQAKSVKDILEVEEQLKSIREEVEASQARLQYIDQNVAMSTINLSFYQVFANTSPQGPGFFSRISFSIKDGWNNVLSFLIDLVGMWPGMLALAAAVIFMRRYMKRRRQRKAMAV